MKLFRLLIIILTINSSFVLAEEKIYIIGVEDYIKYPFQYVENGQYKGKYRELLDEMAKSIGVRFEYKPYKLNKLYEAFYKGKIDFKFPDNPVWRSPEKAKYKIYYSSFFTHYIDGIFVKSENLSEAFKDLKSFGIIDDVLLWVLEKRAKKEKIKLVKTNSCSELIPMLENNEIDAIYCSYDVMRYLLNSSVSDKEIIFNTELPYIDNYYHISTMKHPELIEQLDKWINANRELIEDKAHAKP